MSSEVETSLSSGRGGSPNRPRAIEVNRPYPSPFLIAFFFALTAFAQESPAPAPTPTPSPARSVRISFVPPPIEGTISLGIYDSTGKLVRVLHREAETDDFTIGHDALIAEWDGKNDTGQDLPAGKYSARGFSVGSLGVEGIDYFFNDWVIDENSPHIKRITDLALKGNDLRLTAELASGEGAEFLYDPLQGTMTPGNADPGPMDNTKGKENTRWIIAGSEIQQISPANEVLRHLTYQPNDPQPRIIAASDQEDKIVVLEENQEVQRVRSLALVETKMDATRQQSVSDWKVDFEKSIIAHKDFLLLEGKPVVTGGKPSPEKIALRLQPNPLKRDKPGSVEVAVGFDGDGSYLKTADGLPLRTISDTPHLLRALLVANGEKATDVFQDDGAVVEQFRISGTDQMMAFDCGDFELEGAAPSAP